MYVQAYCTIDILHCFPMTLPVQFRIFYNCMLVAAAYDRQVQFL